MGADGRDERVASRDSEGQELSVINPPPPPFAQLEVILVIVYRVHMRMAPRTYVLQHLPRTYIYVRTYFQHHYVSSSNRSVDVAPTLISAT